MIYNQWYATVAFKYLKKGKILAAKRFGENLAFFRNQ